MKQSSHRVSPEALGIFLVDTDPYLSCDDCFDQLDTYIERLFHNPSHQDLAMQVHLAACGACAEEASTLMELLGREVTPG